MKLPDVALLPPLIRPNSVDYRREQLIRQIRTARQLATGCTQQAQQHMKLYYGQHAKDNPFKVGHKVWIYNPAVKPSLSKKLCSLWHGPFCLVHQVTPASSKVCNLQGKLQKGSVHVNLMKQYFSYDDLKVILQETHLILPPHPTTYLLNFLPLKTLSLFSLIHPVVSQQITKTG